MRAILVLAVAFGGGCGPRPEQAPFPPSAGGAGSGGTAGATIAGAAGNLAGGAGAGGAMSAGAGGGGGSAVPECSSLLCQPLGSMPASINDTGLFPAAPDFSQRSERLLEYVPDPPLWSDGLEKQRFLLLPEGSTIDNADRTRWTFPEGTIAVKTFFDDGGLGGAPRPVETRLIRAGAAGVYEFYVYQWNEDGSDAALVVNDVQGNINAEVPVTVVVNRTVDGQPLVVNGGEPFEHVLPSRNACGECHEKNASVAQTLIGFDELRLNSRLTPAAPTTQLQAFAEAGLFTQPLPAELATITDDSDDGGRLLRIKRFVFGNCVSCHNGQSVVDLRPDVFVENTVGRPTEAQSVMPPEGWLRVVPGDPESSVLYVQMQRVGIPEPGEGMNRLRPMPPIGLADVAVEPTSLQDVFDWIDALPP